MTTWRTMWPVLQSRDICLHVPITWLLCLHWCTHVCGMGANMLSRGSPWSLCNRHFPRDWDRLGFYADKQWLLRNNHRGPRLNKYDLTFHNKVFNDFCVFVSFLVQLDLVMVILGEPRSTVIIMVVLVKPRSTIVLGDGWWTAGWLRNNHCLFT